MALKHAERAREIRAQAKDMEDLVERIEQALAAAERDAIERCAKIVDEYRDADMKRMAGNEDNEILQLVTILRTEMSDAIRALLPADSNGEEG